MGPNNGSMRGSEIEGNYEREGVFRRQQIAESEHRHANYSDPPRRDKRWWQFWKRDREERQ